MAPQISELIERIRGLELELAKKRDELRFSLEGSKVRFEREILLQHRKIKIGLPLLDAFITLYQLVCFPVYNIPKVRRSDYLVFDRHTRFTLI